MKNSVQTLAVIMAVVVLALPAIAQQPENKTTAVAKQTATGCPACKAAQGEECAECPVSCEECQEGDQPCAACIAARAETGVLACDKCKVFVNVTSDNQAQQACTACDSKCPYCSQATGTVAECTAPAQCSIGDCTPQSCQDCPSCPSTNSFASAERLPGSVSFVNENAADLAGQRMQLADDLVAYLSSQKHKPEHIRQVLRMALESTADDAHRAAMTMRTSDSFNVGTTTPCQSGCTDHTMAQLSQMVFEMRKEMDMMSEGMRFLARHMQEQTSHAQQNANMQNRNTQWTSQSSPTPPRYSTTHDMNSTTAQLQQRIRELEQQLQRAQQAPANTRQSGNSTEQRLSASWNPQGQLQPAAWESEPLRPMASLEMQLNPAPMRVSTMVARQYYVGDLMSPPFASATLRLMQQIKSTVAPDSWEQASIQIVSPSVSLLVTQTPENHEKIASMLNAMRGGESFH